jgi:hypothetical protein
LDATKVKQIVKDNKGNDTDKWRSFQPVWYKGYPWLTLCVSKKKAFCFICRNATKRKLVNFSKNAEDAFTTVGFFNWRNACNAFKKHQGSDAHKEAQEKCIALKKRFHPDISEQPGT